MMCTAFKRRMSKQGGRSVRVHSNGTVKRRPIRVGFRVLARSRLEADPNGTSCADLFFERGVSRFARNTRDLLELVERLAVS